MPSDGRAFRKALRSVFAHWSTKPFLNLSIIRDSTKTRIHVIPRSHVLTSATKTSSVTTRFFASIRMAACDDLDVLRRVSDNTTAFDYELNPLEVYLA